MSYSIKNLREVEDLAPKYGVGDTQEARFPTEELGAEETGLAYHVVVPGKRQGFAHRHEAAEEVYVVISGSGRVKLDDEVRDISTMNAVRVAPSRQETMGSSCSPSGPTTPGTARLSRGTSGVITPRTTPSRRRLTPRPRRRLPRAGAR